MVDHEARLWLNDLFENVPGAREDFKRVAGVDPEHAPTWMLYGGIHTIVETEIQRRREEREDTQRAEDQEFAAKMEQVRLEALRYSVSEIGRIIREGNAQNAAMLEQIVGAVQEGSKALQSDSQGKKYLPMLISYTDCWRKHDSTENSPEGRPGPSQCIHSLPEEDGIHYRCLTAYSSQNPGDAGFARLRYQIFHAELLRQGDCPRPLSRSITRRIPVISWLLVKPDKCILADGGEYVLKAGGKFERVSD